MRTTLQSIAAVFNTDFCPGANRYLYWMKNPLYLLLLSAACCFYSGAFLNPALHVVGGIVLLVVAIGWLWPAISVQLLTCRLIFERSRCREGDTVTISLSLQNRSWFPVWGLTLSRGFLLEPPESTGSEIPLTALGRLPARQTSRFTWQFRPTSRGLFPDGIPLLETRFPFGLSSATTEIQCDGQLIVWPAIVPLNAIPESLSLMGREDRLSERHAGDFGDVLGTRSFRQGDSLRRIHWSQSARLDRLIVCERQAAWTCSVSLHPDLRSSSHRDSGPESLEQLLKITASVLHHFFTSGVGCTVTMEGVQLTVPAGQASAYRKVMDDLSRTPKGGWENSRLPLTSRETDLVITTASAHRTGPSRTIVLETESAPCESCHTERIWCRIPPRSRLEDFAHLWRRACGVA